MHDYSTVQRVLDLADDGLNQSQIARETGLSRSTVKDWLAGKLPHSVEPPAQACGHGSDCLRRQLMFPAIYSYMLGMYLGDGCISELRRGVHSFRVSLDSKYPEIIFECETMLGILVPDNREGHADVRRGAGCRRVRLLEALAMPVSTTRSRHEAHAKDRTRAMAAIDR